MWTHATSHVRNWTRYETSISAVEKLYQSYTCHVFIGYCRLNYFQVYFLHRMLSVCDVRVTLLSAAHFKLLLHQEGKNDLLLQCFCDMLIVTFFLFLSKFAVCGALSFSLSACLSLCLYVCLSVILNTSDITYNFAIWLFVRKSKLLPEEEKDDLTSLCCCHMLTVLFFDAHFAYGRFNMYCSLCVSVSLSVSLFLSVSISVSLSLSLSFSLGLSPLSLPLSFFLSLPPSPPLSLPHSLSYSLCPPSLSLPPSLSHAD